MRVDWRYLLKSCAIVLVFVLGLTVGSAAWELAGVDHYNRFAKAYNDFIASENKGVLDLKKLHRMRTAWRDLEKSAGWPDERSR